MDPSFLQGRDKRALKWSLLFTFLSCVKGDCLGDGGYERDPVPCVFPFTFTVNKRDPIIVSSCEDTLLIDRQPFQDNSLVDPQLAYTNTSMWCATNVNYDSRTRSLRKQWGYCACETESPTAFPTTAPTVGPTSAPTSSPTLSPTSSPTTSAPTLTTTVTEAPTLSDEGIGQGSGPNTRSPVSQPTTRGDDDINDPVDSLTEKNNSTSAEFSLTLEGGQIGIITFGTIAYVTALVLACLATYKCAAHSMRFPFEDISSSNIAARLNFHYDRAGVFGGCLASGMGWREAAILLSGSGKLPHMLFMARLVSTLCCLLVFGFTLASPDCKTCFARGLLLLHSICGIFWGILTTLLSISLLKWFHGSLQQKLDTLDQIMSKGVSVGGILIVEFSLFVLGSVTGFSGLVVQETGMELTVAASLSLTVAIISILGPCLAAHTVWIGYDLNSLTPNLEALEIEDDDEESNQDDDDSEDEFDRMHGLSIRDESEASGKERNNRRRSSLPPLPSYIPESRRASGQFGGAAAMNMNPRRQSFQNGSAKYASKSRRKSRRSSINLNGANFPQSFKKKTSVAQYLLKYRGAWAKFDFVIRLLTSVVSLSAMCVCFRNVDSTNNGYQIFLGVVALFVFLQQTLRLGVDMFHLYKANNKSAMEGKKVKEALEKRRVEGNWVGSGRGQIVDLTIDILAASDNDESEQDVVLSWKNTMPGWVFLIAEGAFVTFFVIGLACSSRYSPYTKSTSESAGMLALAFVSTMLLCICFSLSYIASFGYAGGEIRVPKSRISALIRSNTQTRPDNDMQGGFIFPSALQQCPPEHSTIHMQHLPKLYEVELDSPPSSATQTPSPDSRGQTPTVDNSTRRASDERTLHSERDYELDLTINGDEEGEGYSDDDEAFPTLRNSSLSAASTSRSSKALQNLSREPFQRGTKDQDLASEFGHDEDEEDLDYDDIGDDDALNMSCDTMGSLEVESDYGNEAGLQGNLDDGTYITDIARV